MAGRSGAISIMSTAAIVLALTSSTIITMLLGTNNVIFFAAAFGNGYHRCSPDTYDPKVDTQFNGCAANFAHLVTNDLLPGPHVYCPGPGQGAGPPPVVFYGRSYCTDKSLRHGDCVECQKVLARWMDDHCVNAYGATFYNDECEVRFENYPII